MCLLNSPEKSVLAFGNLIIMHAKWQTKGNWMRANIRWEDLPNRMFVVEPLGLSWYFPLPDPGRKTHRTGILSSTHRSQIGWDSALNDVAILSAHTFKLRVKKCVFGCLAFYITSLVLDSSLKKKITHAHTHVPIQVHINTCTLKRLLSMTYKGMINSFSQKKTLKKEFNKSTLPLGTEFGNWALSVRKCPLMKLSCVTCVLGFSVFHLGTPDSHSIW